MGDLRPMASALLSLYDRGMIRRLLCVLAVSACALAVVALTPLGAQAQSAVTITVGSTGNLAKSRVVVTVPVQITCAPVGTLFDFEDSATIEQAAGRAIASGSGSAGQPSVVCDGTPQPVTFTFLADPTGPPFHRGYAAVEVFLFVSGSDGSESGSSGLQTIKLKG